MIKDKAMPACPVETTLLFLGDRWKILILRDLLTGTKRFNELQKSLKPISQKVLTSNLRDLEALGILTRQVYPVVPPKVEYSLTDLGKSLSPIIDSMWDWGLNYQKVNQAL